MEIINSLVIEVLLAGSVASIWIILIFVLILNPSQQLIDNIFILINQISSFLLVIYIGLSYVIGWGVSFLAEIILDPIFQNRFRNSFFKEQGISFFEVRSMVFQHGSQEVINDIQYDRSLLRIVRSNVFNFFILSVLLCALTFVQRYDSRFLITATSLAIIFSIVSFFQWRYRYKSTFMKFLDLYKVIVRQTAGAEINHGVRVSEQKTLSIHKEKKKNKRLSSKQK